MAGGSARRPPYPKASRHPSNRSSHAPPGATPVKRSASCQSPCYYMIDMASPTGDIGLHELLILRHAKSDWGTEAPTDFERPLNTRGARDAERMGGWLAEQRSAPAYVVSSPADRARQTALPICRALGYPVEDIVWDKRIYEASLVTLLGVLADVPTEIESVMIVGHNPGLELLAEYLTGTNIIPPPGQKPFPTAALAVLQFEQPWDALEENCAKLTSLARPREVLDAA